MLSVLEVHLLGALRLVYRNELVVGINTPRLQSLLAYLILNAGTPQLRQNVAFRLWPDSLESNARNSLRQFLHQLRGILPEADRFLAIDANTVWWQRDEEQTVDVWAFEHALAQADVAERQGDRAGIRRALEEAVAQYDGDLLPACYDEWIAGVRDDLHQRYQRGAARLVRHLEDERDYEAALKVAEGMLRCDPLEEDAYGRLMRLHALDGDRAAVRRTYQAAVDTFRRELGIEPDGGLRDLYDRLVQTSHPVAQETAAGAGSAGLAGGASNSLVGRQAEWQRLRAVWGQVTAGLPHLILISGEAGIGKSRLAEELFTWVKQQGMTAVYARSYGAEGRLSLSPVTELLRSPALRPHWDRLDRVWLTEVARLLPELLAERKDLEPPQPITEAGGRQRFFEALARAALARPSPLLIWIDDLHWCDRETIEWLHFVLRFAGQGRLLILGTARSEELPPDHPLSVLGRQLQSESMITRLDLAPLDAAETARLAGQVVGRELDEITALRLYRETEGNALFVVEAARSGVFSDLAPETHPVDSPVSGAAPAAAPVGPHGETAPALPLPPRVHAVIAGRLALLSPPARRVAEIGAAVGRAFTLGVLLQVEGENEDATINALDELWQKRVIREQNPGEFDFTHDKLREVALAEISPPQRRLYHRKIAQALETLNAGDLDPAASQIAAQYEQAGQFEQAIPYYEQTAAVAARVYANHDAIAILTHALALLARLPPGPKRDARDLDMQLALARLYRISKGWASAEVERALNRALVLSDRIGDARQRAQTLYGLQSLHVVAARLEKVEHTHEEMRDLFTKTIAEPLPPFADLMYTGAQFHMGRLVEAQQRFEEILAIRDPRHIGDLQDSQGVNYLVLGQAWNSHTLWCLGYPDRALASAVAAVTVARENAQPFNQALAVTYLAMLQEMRADAETLRAQAEEAVILTREFEAPYYYAWASILAAFARAWLDPQPGDLKRVKDAIDAFCSTGGTLRQPYHLSLLARLCGRLNEPEQGLDVIEQASTASLQNQERWWDAELHRLRGELMVAQGAAEADVEAAFWRAIEVARSQGARSLELRAATSLARLHRRAGAGAGALSPLVAVYGHFTEGLATPDLLAAADLLAGSTPAASP